MRRRLSRSQFNNSDPQFLPLATDQGSPDSDFCIVRVRSNYKYIKR